MIDKTILKNCKRRHTNLAVAWIDYHKAYDMTPHSCITECLEMIGAASRIRSFVQKTTPLWRTKLIAGDSLSPLLFVICVIPMTLLLGSCKAGYHLGKESLKVNHLLFMDDLKLFGKSSKEIDSLIRTVFVFSQDIQIEFGVKKCGVVIIKRGKVVTSDGIQLPNGESIKTVDDEGYRYLGMLEIDQIMQQQMKVLIQKEYLRRTKKILKSKLNGKNIVLAINSWAVSLMQYEAGIINWTDEELKALHRKTHKKLTMYGALHPRSDVHSLYLTRKSGRRGLIGIEECVKAERNNLALYVSRRQGEMARQIVREGVVNIEGVKDGSSLRKENKENHQRQWHEKALHGRFITAVKDDMDKEKNWEWLCYAGLKKETESTIFAAQEQAIATNSIRHSVYKENVANSCRICGSAEETVAHITTECQMLAQRYCKERRHDQVAKVVYGNYARRQVFPARNHGISIHLTK